MALGLAAGAVSCQGRNEDKRIDRDGGHSGSGILRLPRRSKAIPRSFAGRSRPRSPRIYNARKLLVTDDPRIEFFDEFGQLASILHFRQGEYNQVARSHRAPGHVVVTSVRRLRSRNGDARLGRKAQRDTFGGFREIHEEGPTFSRATGFAGTRGSATSKSSGTSKAYLRDDDGSLKEEIEKDSRGARSE